MSTPVHQKDSALNRRKYAKTPRQYCHICGGEVKQRVWLWYSSMATERLLFAQKEVWLRRSIIAGANPKNCLKTTSIVGRLFANLGSEAKKSGIQQKTNIWDVSEGGREWKNFCDLEKLVNAKLPSCKGLRMGVHRNEEAAHSNLISFHQHLVDQTITLETCSTFKLTFISHYIRKKSLWRNHSVRCLHEVC